jgi:leucyl aminopeptidase
MQPQRKLAPRATHNNENSMINTTAWTASDLYETGASTSDHLPLWLIPTCENFDATDLSPAHKEWLATQKFKGQARRIVMLPGLDGRLAGAVLGLGDGTVGDPSGPSELLIGAAASGLPPATYRLANATDQAELLSIAWGLGAYAFTRYRKPENSGPRARLKLPEGVDAQRVINTVEAVWFGRDLITTPASDMGPDELEQAAHLLATRHGATVSVTKGNDLLIANFPMIHAVGRASPRAPRLIDLTWGNATAPLITLVGKGITFDTGGLDIKPASGMLLMKKDMGGAATALTLAHMIMGQNLNCRLRVLIPAAENSIAGDAFRPGDILKSRAGLSVEIGNTDAEGRLVLADALALADDESPDSIFVFATLTGAARSALGPDLPAFFTDDDHLGQNLPTHAASIGDPLWRMPLWPGYKRHLDSDIADMNNVWDTPFAGAITAALFLRRFVTKARRFAHFDLYGWRSSARPLGPKGGEPQTARAVMEQLRRELTS